MKKYALLLAAATFVVAGQAQAQNYGVAGCGLGSIVMGKDSQISAATTNATGMQTFGITSGTSNCTDDGAVSAANEMPVFVEANRVALANDVARGSGETLANLSEVMGCANAAHLASTLQKNYRVIFPNGNSGTDQITDSIKSVVKGDSELASTCAI